MLEAQPNSETQIWIEKLEAAMAQRVRLKPVSMAERGMVMALMVAAGRSDLAMETYRLLPIARGDGQPLKLREFHAQEMATLTPEK